MCRVACLVAAALLSGTQCSGRGASGAIAQPSDGAVLVLPFRNESSEGLEWIGESLAEAVTEFVAARGLLVVDRDARLEALRRLSLAPAGRLTRASQLKLAELLDARYVVTGHFERTDPGTPGSGDLLRVEATCLDTERMQAELCAAEQGALDKLPEVQARLAWRVLRHFAPAMTPPLERFVSELARLRLDALENYFRGLLAETPEQKHRHFTQSARLAPDFSAPHFELGRLHFRQQQYRVAATWLEKVRPGFSRYWQAQFLLGLCRYYTAEYEAAEAVLARVAEHIPMNEVVNNLGAAQARQNRPTALENFMKALEGDPDDADYNFNVGYLLWKRGEFDRAAAYLGRVLEIDPDDAEAGQLLRWCGERRGPRRGDRLSSGRERLKHNFEERAWRELSLRLTANGS